MKRTWLLGIVVVALIAIALPAMAATTWGFAGEMTYGVIGTGSTAADAFGNAYLNINATIDANNTAQLELYANNLGTVETTGVMGAVVCNDFYWQSDVGGILGLDKKTVDPVLSVGYGVYDLPDYNLTQSGPEGIAALGVDSGNADGMFGGEIGHGYGLIALNTSVMGMFNIVLATSGNTFTTAVPEALLGAYGTIGPVSVEAGWVPKGTTSGYIPIGAQFNYTVAGIALAAMGSFVDNLNSGGTSTWAGAIRATYQSNYTIDFAIVGNTSGLTEGTGDIIANITKSLGVIGTVWLDLATGGGFDAFEASAWYMLGPAKLRLGYLYEVNTGVNLGGTDLNAPANNFAGGGGIYLTCDMSF
ncbi:MAG: hypothetical protein ABSF77_03550 [Spirochaetia bacterium]|jgi:hypothetical protein